MLALASGAWPEPRRPRPPRNLDAVRTRGACPCWAALMFGAVPAAHLRPSLGTMGFGRRGRADGRADSPRICHDGAARARGAPRGIRASRSSQCGRLLTRARAGLIAVIAASEEVLFRGALPGSPAAPGRHRFRGFARADLVQVIPFCRRLRARHRDAGQPAAHGLRLRVRHRVGDAALCLGLAGGPHRGAHCLGPGRTGGVALGGQPITAGAEEEATWPTSSLDTTWQGSFPALSSATTRRLSSPKPNIGEGMQRWATRASARRRLHFLQEQGYEKGPHDGGTDNQNCHDRAGGRGCGLRARRTAFLIQFTTPSDLRRQSRRFPLFHHDSRAAGGSSGLRYPSWPGPTRV